MTTLGSLLMVMVASPAADGRQRSFYLPRAGCRRSHFWGLWLSKTRRCRGLSSCNLGGRIFFSLVAQSSKFRVLVIKTLLLLGPIRALTCKYCRLNLVSALYIPRYSMCPSSEGRYTGTMSYWRQSFKLPQDSVQDSSTRCVSFLDAGLSGGGPAAVAPPNFRKNSTRPPPARVSPRG